MYALALSSVLSSVLSGCVVVGAEVGDAARKRTQGVEETVEGDAGDARESLTTAIRNLRGPAIDFRYTVTIIDTHPQVTSGTYFVDPERWAATTRFTDWGPDGRTRSTMYTTAVDGILFLSVAEWRGAEKGCWAALKRGSAPYGVDAMKPDRPAYVAILDQLRPAPWAKPTTTGLMTAQLRLHEALALLPDGLERKVGLKDLSSIENELVNVVVEIADSRLISITVTRSSLVSPLEAAGLLSRDAARTLRATTLKVAYPSNAGHHAVVRPSDDLIMTREDIAAGQGCHAQRSL